MVRDKIDDGTLPRDAPLKLWAGNGSGKPCTACDHRSCPPRWSTSLSTTTADRRSSFTCNATSCGSRSWGRAALFRPS